LEAYVELIATRVFEASAKKLLTEEDRHRLELLLVADPRRGQVIERTGGFRKCDSPGRAVRRARAVVRG
jgi:hypothetical protein